MPTVSFKNRIARYYIGSTALLIFVLFFGVFYSVKVSVYNDIDRDLQTEVELISAEISVTKTAIKVSDADEWEEIEHSILGINPVFIQLMDVNYEIIDKSPNLQQHQLIIKKSVQEEVFYDSDLQNSTIRQVQFPVFHDENLIGYVLVAMSLQDAKAVLINLAEILCMGYLIILAVLYFLTRFIVGKSIQPITSIMETASLISKDNLSTRIALPKSKDELYKLAETINNLLARIESALEREKQFTSDASHELRTPLAVIKGTLEVLTRKQRTQNEYEEKIKFCISEVDRMNLLVDELLLLARFENAKHTIKVESVFLNALISDVLTHYSDTVFDEKIQVHTFFEDDFYFETDPYLFSIVLHNLISNAIKYSFQNGKININVRKENSQIILSVQDFGIGISKIDIDKIFIPFFRSNPSEHLEIKGNGLGLSIVNRLSSLLNFDIGITSENSGTLVILKLKSNNK